MRRRASFELHRQNHLLRRANQVCNQHYQPVLLLLVVSVNMFANYNNLLWLWIWPACCMLMISSYHAAIPQSKGKGPSKNKLQYHFVRHCLSISLRSRPSYDGMGGMLEELSTKAPCNRPEELDSTCDWAALASSTYSIKYQQGSTCSMQQRKCGFP